MPDTPNRIRKRKLQSADGHLLATIDFFFQVWADIAQQHPELSHLLANLMCDTEVCRFKLAQFYHRCWGGQPKWMMATPEVSHRIRQQRAEWAEELMPCRESYQP